MWCGLNWIQTCVGKTNTFNFHMWQLKGERAIEKGPMWIVSWNYHPKCGHGNCWHDNTTPIKVFNFKVFMKHCYIVYNLLENPNCEKSYEKIQHKKRL
jgi:hypothetical protein